jgi:hypothetical protein
MIKLISKFEKQVCHKCVRCKSCGTTSPGPNPDSTWMYDFSLCMACGQLMEKGTHWLVEVDTEV